jgi:hypothetical protein
VRVDGDADHFDTALLELFQTVIESDQFGRADESEIERIEEDDCVFTLDVIGQSEVILDAVVAQNSGGGETGGGFSDEYGHVGSPFVKFGIETDDSLLKL